MSKVYEAPLQTMAWGKRNLRLDVARGSTKWHGTAVAGFSAGFKHNG